MRRPNCDEHGKRAYSSRYDAFYCPECFQWLERECSCDPDECEFAGRPMTAEGLEDSEE